MKKLSIYFFTILLIFQSSLQAYSSDPGEFISELVKEAISKLSNKSLSDEEKAKFIEEVALEYVDIDAWVFIL